MNETQDTSQSFGLEPGEFAATGTMVGATILSKNIVGKNGYRGVPILRDLLGGERAGVALSKTMRNARLAGAGLGALFGGPLGGLVGLVGANYVGREGLLQTFMGHDLAQRIAYGTKPRFKNKYGNIEDLTWTTTDEKIASVPKISKNPTKEMIEPHDQNVVDYVKNAKRGDRAKNIGDFLREERQRDIQITRGVTADQIAEEVTNSSKLIRSLDGQTSEQTRSILQKAFGTSATIASSSQGLLAAKLFSGTISESFAAISEMSAASSGLLSGKIFPNLRTLLSKTKKTNFIDTYEKAVHARLQAFVDGTVGTHYAGTAATSASELQIAEMKTNVSVHKTAPSHRKVSRKNKKEFEVITHNGTVTKNANYESFAHTRARFEEAKSIFGELDQVDSVEHIKKIESEWRAAQAATASSNPDEVALANKKMERAEAKLKRTISTLDTRIDNTASTNKTLQRDQKIRNQIKETINKKGGSAYSGYNTKGLVRLGSNMLKYATIGQLGVEVLSLGLRGVWTGANKLNNAIGRMTRQEFGSGRAATSDLATSERQRALQAIQTNRMQATAFLGMEARARAMNGYQ